MYEDVFKYPHPSSIADKQDYIKRPMRESNKNSCNSAAVANCIRALTQKADALTQENKDLRQKNFLILQELEEIRETENNELRYREKCLILEHSNETFQNKIIQLMETAENYENLKAEMISMNKELTQEIERNKKLTSENNKLKDKDLDVNQCESFGDVVRKSQKNGIYPDDGSAAARERIKLLEGLVEKLQIELENKRNHVEALKVKISDLEETCFRLNQDKRKSQREKEEFENMNEKLLKALKKKNHVCRHRASTPEIAATQNIAQSYQSLRLRPLNP